MKRKINVDNSNAHVVRKGHRTNIEEVKVNGKETEETA